MNQRLNLALFVISVVGFVVGYVLTNSILYGICTANQIVTDAGCINFYERIGDPLFFGMGALALVFLVLLFVPRAFSAWWKFAIWFVPLATVVFIFVPEPSGWVSPLPAPEQVFQWVSGAYVIISLAIVGWARKS